MFEEIKQIVAKETLLVYPNFNNLFDIHTDASDYQLDSVIIQRFKPIFFYSRKLKGTHTRYTVMENE